MANLKAIRADTPDEVGLVFECKSCVIYGSRINLRFAQGEAQFRQMSDFFYLPSDDSKRMTVPTLRWMSFSGPLVSASIALAWECDPEISASSAATRRDSPTCPRTTLLNSMISRGAEPSVMRGSLRAFVYPSRKAYEIH